MYQKSKPSLQHQRQLLLHNSVIHSFILQMPWHTLNPHLLFTIVCSFLFSFSNFLKLTFCCPFLVHFWICHTSQKSNLANFLVTIDILFWLSGFPMTWQVRKKESNINTYLPTQFWKKFGLPESAIHGNGTQKFTSLYFKEVWPCQKDCSWKFQKRPSSFPL